MGGGENRIFFTLDGSEPTQEDLLYNRAKPIYLTDATNSANIYSVRTDTSTGFLSELIDEYSISLEDPEYTVPDYNVDKCNIIRASVFDAEGKCLDTITGVYFIGFHDKVGYENIYTASIITEPDNLFSHEMGIYTTGIAFDNYIETLGDQNNYTAPYWCWWDANYRNAGIEWERKAMVTIFNEEENMVLSEACGIRIQGGGSRGFLPKSIGCYAREKYGGRNEFKASLFQPNKYPHKFVFFSGGDDNIFKLKDYMVNTLACELNFSTMDFIPCAMFLDGEYWGLYYLTENYNKDYISDHYNVKKNNVIMIKNLSLTEGKTGDEDLFYTMREYVMNHDMSDKENYKMVCELLDIGSCIDYYATLIYLARHGDWPEGNWAVWRVREDDGSIYGDCRWRWMLYDINSGGISTDLIDYDALSAVLARDPLFCALYQNNEFKYQFFNRILYIGREIFSQYNCNRFLDQYSTEMREAIALSNRRFYNETRTDEFIDNTEDVREFFMKRYDELWNIIRINVGEEWLKQNGIQK